MKVGNKNTERDEHDRLIKIMTEAIERRDGTVIGSGSSLDDEEDEDSI
jgi:hypothetical protein